MIIKQTPHMKPQTHKQRTATEEPPCTLRKHACSNIQKFLPQKKNENFQTKNSDIFHISS